MDDTKNHVAKCVECPWSYSSSSLVDCQTKESEHSRRTGHIVMHGKITAKK